MIQFSDRDCIILGIQFCFSKGAIRTMKIFIIIIVFAAIISLVTGCGPGQPFEIEEHFPSSNQAQVHVFLAEY